MNPSEKWLSADEIHEAFGVNRRTVLRYARRKKNGLRVWKHGKVVRVERTSWMRFGGVK